MGRASGGFNARRGLEKTPEMFVWKRQSTIREHIARPRPDLPALMAKLRAARACRAA